MPSETDTQNRLRVMMSNHNGSLWRNNSGVLPDRNGRPVRFGLANDNPRVNKIFKSLDLVGLLPRVIQPSDVGKTIGQFITLESKKPGWILTQGDERGQAQLNFINHVTARGGLARFITDPAQFEEILR